MTVDENLTDQQRAAQVRDWLAENGWYLLAGLVLGIGGLFGWRQWQSYDTGYGEKASVLYEEMLAAVRVNRVVRAEEIAAELARDYGRTPYDDQARLIMARVKLERSLPDEAIGYLEQAIKEAGSDGIAQVARLRLGRVLIQQEKYEDALKALPLPKDSAFAARFHEVRGDAYYAMGKLEEARTEYAAALEAAEADGVVDPQFLQAKLNEAGGEAAPVEAPATAGGP